MEIGMDRKRLLMPWPGTLHDYVHPMKLARDDKLSRAHRCAILCLWASDACAVESHPAFRWLPGTPGPILIDHVMKALQSLDHDPDGRPHRWPVADNFSPESRPSN
jgi:hypothetical protein